MKHVIFPLLKTTIALLSVSDVSLN